MNDSIIYFKVEMGFIGTNLYKYKWNFNDPILITNNKKDFEEEKYAFQINKIENSSDVLYNVNGFFKIPTTDKRFNVFKRHFNNSTSICIQNTDSLMTAFFIADKNYETLIAKTSDSFKKFRWRFQLNLRKNTNANLKCFYSIDNQSWYTIVDCPSITGIRAEIFNTPQDETIIHKETIAFFEKLVEEPIYIDMLREARLILYPNYKSAFAIAVAALETATKEFISRKIETARTLINALPSPDLFTLFRKVLPEIENRIKLKNEYEKKIQTIMVKRNDLMHKGSMLDDYVKISEYITIIEDLIILLDFFSGHNWLDIQHAKRLLENENFN